MDIFDRRRDRSAEMNIIVSCSVIGEGPGTGGSGLEGGSDRGGFGACFSMPLPVHAYELKSCWP